MLLLVVEAVVLLRLAANGLEVGYNGWWAGHIPGTNYFKDNLDRNVKIIEE